MRVIADLHIHSKYSSATSGNMDVKTLSRYAPMKGLKLLGTGDVLHPTWLKELADSLEDMGNGFYRAPNADLYFVAQTEVATIFKHGGKTRRIHHVVLMPSLEVALQASDELARHGFDVYEGRPTAHIHPAELVDILMSIDSKILVFPAHAWTPWWSIFGYFGGVDTLEECYGDRVDRIHALETGLSSDPEMNWRVSQLDRLAILSNSDAHSPWPWRIGREANVFELKELSYDDLYRVIVSERERIVMTIEVDPAYGKYHWSGHRKCGVGPLSPEDVRRLGGRCPVCGRKLTMGVEQRVEMLSDRPRGARPRGARPFVKLLPLSEIIVAVLGLKGGQALYSSSVWEIYTKLVEKFGSEFKVLLEVPREELEAAVGKRLADAIIRVREGKVKIIPGYDGVYGKLILDEFEESRERQPSRKRQRTLLDFFK